MCAIYHIHGTIIYPIFFCGYWTTASLEGGNPSNNINKKKKHCNFSSCTCCRARASVLVLINRSTLTIVTRKDWGNPCPALTCSCWMRIEWSRMRLGRIRIARSTTQTMRACLSPLAPQSLQLCENEEMQILRKK